MDFPFSVFESIQRGAPSSPLDEDIRERESRSPQARFGAGSVQGRGAWTEDTAQAEVGTVSSFLLLAESWAGTLRNGQISDNAFAGDIEF